MSPVNDEYKKESLSVKGSHRIHMCRLAAESSSWLSVDPWEVEQSEYQRTYFVLMHFEEEIRKHFGTEGVRVMLLCGADLLQSFTKGTWKYVCFLHSFVLFSGIMYLMHACLNVNPIRFQKCWDTLVWCASRGRGTMWKSLFMNMTSFINLLIASSSFANGS